MWHDERLLSLRSLGLNCAFEPNLSILALHDCPKDVLKVYHGCAEQMNRVLHRLFQEIYMITYFLLFVYSKKVHPLYAEIVVIVHKKVNHVCDAYNLFKSASQLVQFMFCCQSLTTLTQLCISTKLSFHAGHHPKITL